MVEREAPFVVGGLVARSPPVAVSSFAFPLERERERAFAALTARDARKFGEKGWTFFFENRRKRKKLERRQTTTAAVARGRRGRPETRAGARTTTDDEDFFVAPALETH